MATRLLANTSKWLTNLLCSVLVLQVALVCILTHHKTSPNDVSEATVSMADASWSCRVGDQLSYCVYFESLCLDRNAELVLISADISKHGQPVEMINNLGQAPWHLPNLNDLAHTSYGKYDIPFRSFFSTARYSVEKPEGSVIVPDWSLVASFDNRESNIYHYMNKLQAAFIARAYELGGLKERSTSFSSNVDIMQRLQSPESEFDHAYLFRPPQSSWQQNYGEICLGNKTQFLHESQVRDQVDISPICFERAIIPGAALYLADGLVSSLLFRELAASMKGIRVPESDRNIITIFDRSQGNRKIINLENLTRHVQDMAPEFRVEVIDWDAKVDFRTQALHMARTRILIATHGSILNHNAFMEVSGVVIEIDAYQFSYPLDDQVVLSRGNHYLRYEESLENTRHQGHLLGQDPFQGMTTRACMRTSSCLHARRDADILVNINKFEDILRQAISLVT
jgi:hypothetical protein